MELGALNLCVILKRCEVAVAIFVALVIPHVKKKYKQYQLFTQQNAWIFTKI